MLHLGTATAVSDTRTVLGLQTFLERGWESCKDLAYKSGISDSSCASAAMTIRAVGPRTCTWLLDIDSILSGSWMRNYFVLSFASRLVLSQSMLCMWDWVFVMCLQWFLIKSFNYWNYQRGVCEQVMVSLNTGKQLFIYLQRQWALARSEPPVFYFPWSTFKDSMSIQKHGTLYQSSLH